ncbi:MAG: hypothetical protein ACFCU4_07965 [Puniceicoccaceae bacterium]
MNLSPEQTQAVRDCVLAGGNLSEVQKLLVEKFDLRLTFMQVRFLVEDLDLTLVEKEAPRAQKPGTPTSQSGDSSVLEPTPDQVSPPTRVAVEVDAINTPGTIVSGTVTFSDRQTAKWQLDQMGRLGLIPATSGYQPSPEDVEEFQIQLEAALRQKGY